MSRYFYTKLQHTRSTVGLNKVTLNKCEAKRCIGKRNKETGNDQALPVFSKYEEPRMKSQRNQLERVG